MALDSLDRLILNSIQEGFPVAPRPYDVLAARLGVGLTGEAVRGRVAALKRNGYIRRLGAVFEAAKLGYASTLCAAKVAPEKVESFAALVNAAPEVTHNYLRAGDLNVWFTFTTNDPARLGRFLDALRPRAEELHVLEAERLFKIKVGFRLP